MLLRGQGSRSDGLIAIGLPRADEVAVVAHAMLSKRMGDRFHNQRRFKDTKCSVEAMGIVIHLSAIDRDR